MSVSIRRERPYIAAALFSSRQTQEDHGRVLYGGRITSDGGGMLLAAAERRLKLVEKLAAAIRDPRDPAREWHSLVDSTEPRYNSTEDSCFGWMTRGTSQTIPMVLVLPL